MYYFCNQKHVSKKMKESKVLYASGEKSMFVLETQFHEYSFY